MTKSLNIKTSQKIVPMCYAYTTPQISDHDGWTKIGYTEQKVEDRIDQQTKTANVKWVLGWKGTAIYDDGSGDTFRDRDFHAYLQKNNVERKPDTEWFHIEPKPSHDLFVSFKSNRGILKSNAAVGYSLRAEQTKAVERTTGYFDSHSEEDEPEFLWNAKPRFGKTLTAYDLCKKLNAKKILIVTNRPAIANSWYDDYVKFLGTESGYYFISSVDAVQGKPFAVLRQNMPSDAKGYIEFVSLQDLKGSAYFGGKFDKLKHIGELLWDLLIIDEAHEGVDTYKTDTAFDNIKRKRTLHLSGTPFKALANDKFEEAAIFNWSYADEQNAKRNWDPAREEENPYADLPRLSLYTYQMSEIVREHVEQGADFDDDGENENYAFDLNEFFSVSNGKFKYENAVDKFLDALTHQEKFPFSTPELREELKHTFWLLNRVDSATALARKLNAHPIFKDYEIVLAAGDGRIDDNDEIKKSYDKVKAAIAQHDKTITLSVGQLTTGITVPEWTAVLMLSNVKSPALYMQAAFRAQNPCLFSVGSELFRKENAYVFDFDPARTLDIFEQFANGLSADTTARKGDSDTRKRHVRELLNFFPVYGEDDDGEMVALDAEKVLSIPRKIHAKEVVRRGFMCNFLFQNIGNIFNAPKDVIDIINRFEVVKDHIVNVTDQTKDDLSLNDDGEVELPEQTVIGQAQNLFGDKIYKVADDLKQTVSELMSKESGKEDPFAELKDTFKTTIKDNLVQTVKDSYGKEMTKATEKAVVRQIENKTDAVLERHYGNYKIQKNVIELERKKELENAAPADVAKINAAYDRKQAENKETFVAVLQESAPEITKESAEITVKAVETDKRQKEKDKIENDVRDHLRGFSRTIPSFLMAYGTDETTLENFDTVIPDAVFQEVTTISLKEFRFLRDGGDYTDKETGETKHFNGHLFDPVVFNDSVKEFLTLKKKLANYFDEAHKEDIFDYIPPQKNNQIFTPKKVVKEMVDLLENENPECFDNPDHTFIDLYMKSGLYITEIVKRLFNSEKMKRLYPDGNKRLDHIFEKQMFGLAPTEIIYRIAVAFILGFDENAADRKHNFKLYDALPAAKKGTLEQELDKLFVS